MDLLDLAQLESNTFSLNPNNFSLIETIESSFKVLKNMAKSKNVTFDGPKLT